MKKEVIVAVTTRRHGISIFASDSAPAASAVTDGRGNARSVMVTAGRTEEDAPGRRSARDARLVSCLQLSFQNE